MILKERLNVQCFECHNIVHYKSECPYLSEKKNQEIRARRENIKRAALLAKERSEALLVNHDEEFTDDDEANVLGVDMGLMAMSDDDTSVEEVHISNSNLSQYTLAHKQC